MKSIRQRTLTLIIGLLMCGLLVLTLFNWHDSNHEIAEIYDAQLAQNARLLQGVMHMPLPQHEQLWDAFNNALSNAEHKADGHPYESKMAFQVWDHDGKRLVHTASAPLLDPPPHAAGFGYVTDAKHDQWRSFVMYDSPAGLLIWVGERHDVRSDLVDRIVRHTLGPNLVGSLILAILVWLAIGWGLRPLANLAATLRARHPHSLEPLQLSPLPNELEPMQAALNRVLSQVQDLLGRERRFIADAAHEMRTPLAVLRVHTQNLLAAGTDAEREQSLHSLIVGVDRTSRLVNQLLTMARLEPQVPGGYLQPLDLLSVVSECLAQLTPWLLSKGLEISLESADQPLNVLANRDAIDIALNNLITNAANFSPPGGLITVSLRKHKGCVTMEVRDQGPGIDESQLERLFERFYSCGNDQGAGLGLTIVQAIAKRLQGKITLRNAAQGGLLASLSLHSVEQ